MLAHRAFGAGSEQVGEDHSGLRESCVLLRRRLSILSASAAAVIASFLVLGAECSRVLSDSTGTDA